MKTKRDSFSDHDRGKPEKCITAYPAKTRENSGKDRVRW
jgi:hypothetical protein